MKKSAIVVLLISTFTTPIVAHAQDGATTTSGASTGSGTNDELKRLGFGFALGVEQYRTPYIEEATTNGTNRIVSIDKEYKTLPSVWATLNWNIKVFGKTPDKGVNKTQQIGLGLFAGVKLVGGPGNQAFDGFAIGPQVTFKTVGATARDISLGLGWVTHKTRSLATGIIEGKRLPEDYNDVKYRQNSENSVALMLSVVL